jgi:hypothetical protein
MTSLISQLMCGEFSQEGGLIPELVPQSTLLESVAHSQTTLLCAKIWRQIMSQSIVWI